MTEQTSFRDDLGRMAGGLFSLAVGARDEIESLVRARVDDTIRRLGLVRREEFDAAMDLAAAARSETEALAARVAALEAQLVREEPPKEGELFDPSISS